FKDTKASELGDFIPVKLEFDEYENVVSVVATTDYSGHLLMIFENGKAAKVPLSAYETKTNRKKLANAYTSKSKLVKMFVIADNTDILVRSTNGRAIVFNTGMILPKAARDTIGVQVMTLKAKALVDNAYVVTEEMAENVQKFIVKNIPAAGSLAKDLDDPDQLTL
nr:topoisomerase IV [Oscillospiraceae bacterium]